MKLEALLIFDINKNVEIFIFMNENIQFFIFMNENIQSFNSSIEISRLEPLLQRIKEKPNAVVMPIIDTISEETLEYLQDNDTRSFQVGGFTWSGHFTWINIQEKDLRSRASSVSPVNSPTMAGGLFAIDRLYFWKLGGYDDRMDGWGGENLEISFRVSEFLT